MDGEDLDLRGEVHRAHHHGVGRSKRSAMGMEWGAGVRVLEALRSAADPSGVLAVV